MQENIIHQVAAILRKRYCSPEYSQLKRLLYEDTFPLSENFINLALVKEEEQKPKDQAMKTETNVFRDQLLQNFETIHQPKESIELRDIFTKQKDDKSSAQHLLIEGRAGVGKSTLCQYIANQWAEEQGTLASWRQRFTWVVWIPLRELTEDNSLDFTEFTLAHYIHNKYLTRKERRQIKVEKLAEKLEGLIEQKQILLLLDGYDEIAEWLNTNKQHKEFFEEELLACSYWLLTSRPYYISKSTLQADHQLEIIGFVNENIPQYIKQFFKEIEAKEQQLQTAKANALIQFLRSNPSVWGMSHIPINLELLCSIWEEEGEISKQHLTLTQLYNQLVLYIFKRYLNKPPNVTIKNLSWHDLENDENLDCQPMLAFLELLAWQGMQQNSLILSGKNIIELANTIYPTDHQQRERLGKAVLKELGLLKGIGIARDSVLAQDYYFVHLTFQEYWTARYIVSCWKKNTSLQGYQNIQDFIVRKKFDPRYEIVWWFVAGLLSEESAKLSDFFSFFEEEPKDLTGLNLALLQLRCLDECKECLDKMYKDRILARLVRWIDDEITYQKGSFFADYLVLSSNVLREKIIQKLLVSSLNDKRKVLNAMTILVRQADLASVQAQQVLSLLAHPDKSVSYYAARILIWQAGNQGLPEVLVQQMLPLLKDTDEHVRSAAIEILVEQAGNQGWPEVLVQQVLLLLKNCDGRVRFPAVKILKKQAARQGLPETLVQQVFSLLKDDDEHVRSAAVKILGKQAAHQGWPEGLMQQVLPLVKDPDEDVRFAVVKILGKQAAHQGWPEAWIQQMLPLLRDSNLRVRYAAAEILRKQAARQRWSVALMQQVFSLLKDADWQITYAVAKILRKQIAHQGWPEVLIQQVFVLLTDSDGYVRSSAVGILVELAEHQGWPEALTQQVISLLNDPDVFVRSSAVEILGKQAAHQGWSEALIQQVLALLTDFDGYVRSSAVGILGKLAAHQGLPEALIQQVFSLLNDPDMFVRSSAVEILGKQAAYQGWPEASVHQLMLPLIKDSNELVRSSAIKVLGNQVAHQRWPEALTQQMLILLKNSNELVGSPALKVLVKQAVYQGWPEALVQQMLILLKDSDWHVRSFVVEVFGKEAVHQRWPEVLIQQMLLLLKDSNELVRSSAVKVLEKQVAHQGLPEALKQQVFSLLKNLKASYYATVILCKLKTLSIDILQALEIEANALDLFSTINNFSLETLTFYFKNLRDKDQAFPFPRLLLLKCLKQKLPLYFVDNELFIGQRTQGVFTSAQKCQFINSFYQAFYEITGMLPELFAQQRESFQNYLIGQMLTQAHTLFQSIRGQVSIDRANKQGYIDVIKAILSSTLIDQFLDKELQAKIINYAAERKLLTFQNKKVVFLRYFGMTSQLQGEKTMEAKTPADKPVVEKVFVKREEIILDVDGITQAITDQISDASLQKILIDLLKEAKEKQALFNKSSLQNHTFCQSRDKFISRIKSIMQTVSKNEKYKEDHKDVALTQIFPDILFPFWRCRPYPKIETAKEVEQNQQKEQQLFLQQQQLRAQSTFLETLTKISVDRELLITAKPKIYFMYAWPLDEYQSREIGVQPFLQGLHDDLTAAGIEVIFDKEGNFSGNNLSEFMGQILDDYGYVMIFGTESFRHKWFGEKTALQFEGKLLHLKWLTDLGENRIIANQKTTIIPWVLTGIRETAIPENILPAKNTTVRALYTQSYIKILSSILSVAYSVNIKTIETYFSQITVTHVVGATHTQHENKQPLAIANQASLDTTRASENHEHKGIEPLSELPPLKGAVAMLESNTNVQVPAAEKQLSLLDKASIANKTPVELYRYLSSQGYTWRHLLNTHVFDLNLTVETRKASEAIVKELITKRDSLDKELYVAAVQCLLGDYGKLPDEQRYYYNRLPQNTGPRNDLTGYKLEYYILDILDKQQNDQRMFTVSIIAPGSRDLTSDIDTTVEVTCHQKVIALPLNLPKEFGELSLSEMDSELVIQAGMVYHFNQLNCEKLGQTSAESRDSNVYIDGFMHALAFPKFDDFVWQDEKQREKSGIQLVTNKSKKAFYQAQKHQRNVLELAASLLPLRAYYQADDKEFTKQLKALFAVNSLDKSNQASFDQLMQEVIKKTNDLYQYQQTQIHTFKTDEAIQAQYVTRCSKVGIALSPASLTHERAEDFEAYVNNILYAKHIMNVAKVRQQLKEMAKELRDEKHELVVLQAKLQELDKDIQSSTNKIAEASDQATKRAFTLSLETDQKARTELYQKTFFPKIKTYVANLQAFAQLHIQQQEALINAQLFALEAYTNYSAPYHVVQWMQSGDESVRIDRRRVALCSTLQQMGFQLLHAQHYQALGMEPGQILYRVAKYGQRVADVFFGDNQWFGDQEHAYHDSDKVLQRFKSVVLARTFGEQLYDLLNLQIALVKDIKKNADIPVHEKGHQAMLLCLKRYRKDYKRKPVDDEDEDILDAILGKEKVDLEAWLKVKDTILIDTAGKLIVEAYRAKTHHYPEASSKQLCWGSLFNATGSNVQQVPAANDTYQQPAVKK